LERQIDEAAIGDEGAFAEEVHDRLDLVGEARYFVEAEHGR
jgi:hypothetical protein